jgi:bifunctional UDP-N-acetylglucosamine pyrophosphorylase / glucosamine-1-phosphate N-acetyltransferase
MFTPAYGGGFSRYELPNNNFGGRQGQTDGRSGFAQGLVMLKNRPIIAHLLDELKTLNSADRHVVVVGHKAELVRNFLGPDYLFAVQSEQRGTAHAVASAKDHVSAKNVLVLYGDMPFIKASSIEKLLKSHEQVGSLFSMFTTKVRDFEAINETFLGFGRILRGGDGKIKCIREFLDATDEERAVTEVNPGIYLFDSRWLFRNLNLISPKNRQEEFYLTDIVEVAINQDISINSMLIEPLEVFGINTQAQRSMAEELLRKKA